MNPTQNFTMPVNQYMSFEDMLVSSIEDGPLLQSVAQTALANPWTIRGRLTKETEALLRQTGPRGLATLLATTGDENLIDEYLEDPENWRFLACNRSITEKQLETLIGKAAEHSCTKTLTTLVGARKDFGYLVNRYGILGDLTCAAVSRNYSEPYQVSGLHDGNRALLYTIARYLVLADGREFEHCHKYFSSRMTYYQWVALSNSAMRLVPKFPVTAERYKSLASSASLEYMPPRHERRRSELCPSICEEFSGKIATCDEEELHAYLLGLQPYQKRELLKAIDEDPYTTYPESFAVLVLAAMGRHGRVVGMDPYEFLPERKSDIPDLWSEPTRMWVAKHCAKYLESYHEYLNFTKLLPEWGGSLYDLLRVSRNI